MFSNFFFENRAVYEIMWANSGAVQATDDSMTHFILSSVACPFLYFFSTLSHTWHDLKIILNKMCVLIFFYNFDLKHISFQEELREI
jgi:hypothetical protein